MVSKQVEAVKEIKVGLSNDYVSFRPETLLGEAIENLHHQLDFHL